MIMAVTILSKENHPSATTNLRALAQGLDRAVISLNGYMANGFMFRTKDSERTRETQNSGIVVNGDCGSSTLNYYGLLQEIIEVQYEEEIVSLCLSVTGGMCTVMVEGSVLTVLTS
uniref:Uncharacterized protein n=1 Tax=Chenopodium quinoa TaxID=63459 RepID=A0A803MYW9_CHEQI